MLSLPLANLNEPNMFTVCALGIGIVFSGLIAIIILCKILGVLCRILEKTNNGKAEKTEVKSSADSPVAAVSAPVQIPNRRETVAAVAAAIAEDLGTDVSAIRIVSIEKI